MHETDSKETIDINRNQEKGGKREGEINRKKGKTKQEKEIGIQTLGKE